MRRDTIAGVCYGVEVMSPATATVRDLLARLPDDCSLDDILYHLYVVQKVERGLVDAARGDVVPHAVAMQELRRKWLTERDE
jgi:hypothetical protein